MWFRSKTDVSSTALQTNSNLHQQVFHSLREVTPESWNRLIGDAFPFAEYNYLLALEEGQIFKTELLKHGLVMISRNRLGDCTRVLLLTVGSPPQ